MMVSSVPAWWDNTITIFNKHENRVTNVVTWKKTIIDNCFWKQSEDKMSIGSSIIDTDSIICRIPMHEAYVNPFDWSEQMIGFTLKPGDIIVLGAVDDYIDEYSKGHRSTDLVAKYHMLNACMEIKAVSINTMSGMINKHYKVRGI